MFNNKKDKMKFNGKKIFLTICGIMIIYFLIKVPKLINIEENFDPIEHGAEDIEPGTENFEKDELIVVLVRNNGEILEIELEDYIVGVVGAEMPASFTAEALKAQAIASRTYTLKRLSSNSILTDTTSNQVYKDEGELQKMWGTSYELYYQKIKNAVLETKGQYLAYNEQYIDALFHSTNNGITEDSSYVWGGTIPYLKSVPSPYDKDASTYYNKVTKEIVSINNILGTNITSSSDFLVLSRTANGSIDKIRIAGKIFTGKEVREKLKLKSTDFTIIGDNFRITFETKGYGHAVGMSQYGAQGMGQHGYNYKEILSHYYLGVDLLNYW